MSDLNVRTWDELEKYQPTVMKMLKQIIIKNRIAHAYLFEGMKGTGKKKSAYYSQKLYFVNSPLKDINHVKTAPNVSESITGITQTSIWSSLTGIQLKKNKYIFYNRNFQKKR